jgi:hypothetical protein
MREKRKDRGFGPLADDDGEAVRKLLDGSALFERSQILAERQ